MIPPYSVSRKWTAILYKTKIIEIETNNESEAIALFFCAAKMNFSDNNNPTKWKLCKADLIIFRCIKTFLILTAQKYKKTAKPEKKIQDRQ